MQSLTRIGAPRTALPIKRTDCCAVETTLKISRNPAFAEAGLLIVEDEQCISEILIEVCKQAGFKHVFVAQSAVEAFQMLRRHKNRIDLLSLDLKLPDGDGIEIAQAVANSHERIVGLVMLTGYSTDEAAKRFMAIQTESAVARSFLSKPLHLQDYLTALNDALKDIEAKRGKHLEAELASEVEDLRDALHDRADELEKVCARMDSKVQQMDARLIALDQLLRAKALDADTKRAGDLSYVWALTLLFLAVAGALAWASFYLPFVSVLAVAAFSGVVLMIIAAFDLSKGGKLSEKTLREVLRRSFSFLSRTKK